MMRFLAAILGGILGIVVGVAVAFLVAVVITRNDLFGVAFIGFYLAPAGLVFGGTIGAIAGLRLLPHLRERETQRIQSKKLLAVLGAFITGTTILIVLVIWIVRSGLNPPSDQKLLANFDRHEATFNKLIEMLKADKGLTRVDKNWTDPKNPEIIGVSPARISTYRRMLKDDRVPRGFEARGGLEGVEFLYWAIGSAISSDTTKGYAYRTIPPIDVLSSLDGYRPDTKNTEDTVRVYRHIRGNWYLFYKYIPG